MLVLKVKRNLKRSNSLLHFIREILCAFMSLGKLPVLGHIPSEGQRFTMEKLL